MKIKLLVIRSEDIEKTKEFYEKIGLSFIKEQHNGSPIHYSSQIEDVVFEIYPASSKSPVCNTRLGFESSISKEYIKNIAIGNYTYNEQKIYILEDPDGRKVEIY